LVPTYIARRSGHSRGASVDLTLVRLSGSAGGLHSAQTEKSACNSPRLKTDAELDMGTRFDCFDRLSRTNSTGLGNAQQANRALLVDVMRKYGFRNYSGEWWHFSLIPEPYPKTYFNFPVREFRHQRDNSEN
jgi:D-alanyl-D-alanine dipeptidase